MAQSPDTKGNAGTNEAAARTESERSIASATAIRGSTKAARQISDTLAKGHCQLLE